MDSTTQKGFLILEKLAQSDGPRGISELSRETELSKSNVQRIVATLCDLGYAEKDDSSRYHATMRMWELGLPVLMRNRVLRAGRSPLKSLRHATDETVVLCLRDGLDLVYIEKLESVAPIRLSCPVGARIALHETAAGRVIAAHLARDEQKRLIEVARSYPSPSIADLRKRLAAVALKGYDISQSGLRVGVNSIAAPIRDERDQVVASIAVSGPEERLTPENLLEFLPAVLEAASKISAGLGHLGGTS